MSSGSRIITTLAVAFLLAPTLLLSADETTKSAATAPVAVTPATASSPQVIPTHAVPMAPPSEPLVVSNVILDKRASGETFVVISTSRTATYRVTSLKNPARLVVDIDSAKNTSPRESYSADTLVLRDVRLAQYGETNRSVVRVVADLNGDPTFDVHATPAGMRIGLRPRGMAKSELSAMKATTPAAETKPGPAVATAPVAPAPVTVAQIDLPEAPATAKVGTAKSPGATSAVVKAQRDAAGQNSMSGGTRPKASSTDSYTPRFDLFLGYSNFREASSGGNRLGWLSGLSTSLDINANRYLGFVADFGAYSANSFGPGAPPTGGQVNAYGTVYTYMFGPRVTFRHDRINPFVQALFGGEHASDVTLNGCSGIGCTPLPFANSFTMSAGGGLDINLARHVALRLFQVEYVMTDFANPYTSAGATQRQNDMRLSAGIVFRFGGERHTAYAPPPPPPPPPLPQPPAASCSADRGMVYADSGDVVSVSAQASSPGNNPLTYSWTATGGAVSGTGTNIQWNSTGVPAGSYTVKVRVDDGRGGMANCAVGIRVDPRPNRPPTLSCSADRHSIAVGDRVQITATANSPDNAPLTYSWRTTGGQVVGTGASVSFDSSGLSPGRSTVTGHVDDGRGGGADCTVDFDVQMVQASAPVIKELEARLALHSVYFPTAQPTAMDPEGGLTTSQQEILMTLASDFKKYLELKPDAHLTLVGHADPRGSVELDKALTDRRVERSKKFLVGQGVPAASIETRSLGKQDLLTSAQVREQMENNPDVTPDDRRRLLGAEFQGIVLAQNRRVDIVLSTTGQQSVRHYPFNARDAHTLLDDKQLVR